MHGHRGWERGRRANAAVAYPGEPQPWTPCSPSPASTPRTWTRISAGPGFEGRIVNPTTNGPEASAIESASQMARMVVGWAMAATEDEQLVELALRMAVVKRQPPAGLLHHSDRGSEFTSDRYLTLLAELGIEVSMSRTANCYDNAVMESFFATLTKECTDRVRFESRQQARSAIFEYLECFYVRSVQPSATR